MKKEVAIKVKSHEQMIKLGYVITQYTRPNLVIALLGDLGAGKTTFTKGIGEALGITKVINSPTFTIMKVYDVTNQLHGIEKLYHLDVYRLSSSESDFELEEYFNLDGLTVIEWADIIKDILPDDVWRIEIKDLGDNERKVTLQTSEDLEEVLREANYEIIH